MKIRKMKMLLALSSLFLILLSCSPSIPEIEGFDSYIWQRDKFGCKGARAEMLDALFNAKDKVLGLREAQALRLLGKADEQEIASRNQKFLVYYLEPNKKCSGPESRATNADALHVRINAIGILNEFFIRKR